MHNQWVSDGGGSSKNNSHGGEDRITNNTAWRTEESKPTAIVSKALIMFIYDVISVFSPILFSER